jgi:DNA gyrase subunit B
MAKELTKKQMEAIDNYGSQIKQLETFQEGVQTRPGMYIGSLQNKGLRSAIKEIFQNAVDQMLDPDSPCDWLSVKYNQNTREVEVCDNGSGIPFDMIIKILTTMHTSKNFVKKPFHYSSGLNGMGASIVNALSTVYIVESYKYDGTAVRQEFKNGYPVTKEPKKIPNKTKKQGTRLYFIPNEDIFGYMNLDWKEVYNLVKLINSFTPIGSEFDFIAIDDKGVTHKERIVNKDGIITDLIMKVKNPLNAPIVCAADTGYYKLETAFCFDGGGSDGPDPIENVTAFSNWSPTLGGTHVDGTIEGITKWFGDYMNKIYLVSNTKSTTKSKKAPLRITPSDVKSGLCVIINAAALEPEYSAQAKEVISNPEMQPFCKETVMKGLDEWAKSNPKDLATLCKYLKEVAELRVKESGEKAKIVQKYSSNILTGYPRKFARPSKVEKDLFIVEGDSAGGSAKTARDVATQGIMPMRGKVISAFDHSFTEFWSNEEAQAIQQLLYKHPYKKGQSVDEVPWEKIIFMADGDVDGAHITSLLLRMFVRYYPELIQAGKVYKAIPPLYGVVNGKQIKYVIDQFEFVKLVEKSFMKNNTISLNDKPLNMRDLTALFMKNEDYVYELKTQMADNYGVDPKILEFALYCYINKFTFKKIQTLLKKKFRFSEVENNKGFILYKGSTSQRNFLPMTEEVINECGKIINIMKENSNIYYTLNGVEASVYDIMSAFEASTPSNIQRYKGLGEMDAEQLAESTMNPENRTLIRYTLDDAKEEIETIRKFESNRSKLLDHVGTVKRSDLLD